MDRVAVRTGLHQLSINYFLTRLGSMAETTKCCATGTCRSYSRSSIKSANITHERDGVNVISLINQFGPLA